MEYLTIKNWESLQHYKDRNPPWIKLATDTFQDYEFSLLSDASKLLAVCIWTLASKISHPKSGSGDGSNDLKTGSIPHDLNWIKRQCHLGSIVTDEHLNELINNGFLLNEVTLAECYQNACLETEGETEEESIDQKLGQITKAEKFNEFWQAYPRKVGKAEAKKKWNQLMKEGVDPNLIILSVEPYIRRKRKADEIIQHPKTFLNQRIFEDDFEPAETQNSEWVPAI